MKVKTLSLIAGAGALCLAAGTASADFIGLQVELVASGVSHDGSGGAYENHDIYQLYAAFSPGSSAEVTAWGASQDGDPSNIWQVLEHDGPIGSGPAGSGFWASALGTALVQANNAVYGIDPTGFDTSTYLTIGQEAGYDPVNDPKTGDPYIFQLVPGFAPDLNGATEVNLTTGGVFTIPDSPYGDQDGDNRVLLATFNVASGEHVEGIINLAFFGKEPAIGASFSTIPAPGALALLGLAGLAGARRRRA